MCSCTVLCVPHVLIYQVWLLRRLHECPSWRYSTVYKTECTVIEWCGHCLRMWRAKDQEGEKRVFPCLFQLSKRNMWDICIGELLSFQVTQEHILVKYHLNPYWNIKHHRRSSIYLSFEALNTHQRHAWFMFHSNNFCTMFGIWNTALNSHQWLKLSRCSFPL